MKAVVSKIDKGEIFVQGRLIASIGKGFALFVGMEKSDGVSNLEALVKKAIHVRIFEDEAGKMQHSVSDKGYEVLCIPNFTLAGSTQQGRRLSFDPVMDRTEAHVMFEQLVSMIESEGVVVGRGEFGAQMDIRLSLNGPVTIVLET